MIEYWSLNGKKGIREAGAGNLDDLMEKTKVDVHTDPGARHC